MIAHPIKEVDENEYAPANMSLRIRKAIPKPTAPKKTG
jgi:hypothetical protein